MRTAVCDLLGIDYPIFAFSHCRDVVAAVSRAGGFGVFGTTRYSPEQLEVELTRLDEMVEGKPYGVDLLFPLKFEGDDEKALAATIPEDHRRFVADLTERLHIPAPKTVVEHSSQGDNLITTHQRARQALEVALRHPVRLIASALGPAPADVVERAKAAGICIGGLIGRPEHAKRHVDAGADVIIAQGTEAGGHTGEVSTMVLVPQVVDAVAPIPVLAAGGIVCGRQIVAALALGAAGVWTGSLWLPTVESEVHPVVKDKLLGASSYDTVRSRCLTGKPIRQLRTPWVNAWESEDAPAALPAPLQALLVRDAMTGIFEHEVKDVMGTAVGQGIGLISQTQSVREVMFSLLEEFADASERIATLYQEAQQ